MAKRRAYSFTAMVVIALAAGFAFQADAGFFIFHDQDSWQAALGTGPGLQYNFNSFTENVSFAASAVNFGPFSLAAAIGVPPPGTDLVVTDDNDPESFTTVDGTPYASMFLDSSTNVLLDFHRPMLAFGAQFVSSGLLNFGVGLSGTRAIEIIEGPPEGGQFFGFISNQPFDSISFLYAGPRDSSASVSLDNVGASAVPEPSSLMILGAGAVAFAAYGARRLRRASQVGPIQN